MELLEAIKIYYVPNLNGFWKFLAFTLQKVEKEGKKKQNRVS